MSLLLDHVAERRPLELPYSADGRGLEIHVTSEANQLLEEALDIYCGGAIRHKPPQRGRSWQCGLRC